MGINCPLVPLNKKKKKMVFSLIPKNQNFDFLCSLFPIIVFVPLFPSVLDLFPCSPEINGLIPLFPKISGRARLLRGTNKSRDMRGVCVWGGGGGGSVVKSIFLPPVLHSRCT